MTTATAPRAARIGAFVPALLLSAYGGVIADRMSRRTLIGGSGRDTFEFYTAGGSRLGSSDADFIADFNMFQGDTILISGGYFSRYFGTGKLAAVEFCYSGESYVGPHVIYDRGSGALYLDASSWDNTPAQVFAYLKPNTLLHYSAISFS